MRQLVSESWLSQVHVKIEFLRTLPPFNFLFVPAQKQVRDHFADRSEYESGPLSADSFLEQASQSHKFLSYLCQIDPLYLVNTESQPANLQALNSA